jgi:cation transport protein ChaC
MSSPTRQNLEDGSYRRSLAIPAHLSWSPEKIEQSLDDMLRNRPEGGPTWVFAYGSLMWNPAIEFDVQRVGVLEGWHRSFCIRSVSGRGSPEHPGRVLALEPGGQTQGLAFRLRDDSAVSELRLLWTRELVSGAYCPSWAPVQLHDGEIVSAIAFAANPGYALYDPDSSPASVAHVVRYATGVFGPNSDYVHFLHAALERLGLSDPYVESILEAMRS